MGKQHGMMFARGGKVRNTTPKVAQKEKPKRKTGRAKQRHRPTGNNKGQPKVLKTEADMDRLEAELMESEYMLHAESDSESEESYEGTRYEGRDWHITSTGVLYPVWILDKEPTIKFTKDNIIQILKRENEIRKPNEIQQRYTDMTIDERTFVGGYIPELFQIDQDIINRAIREFGF